MLDETTHLPGNRRAFPRKQATCPIFFKKTRATQWEVGVLDNYSPSGMLLVSREKLRENWKIQFEVKPMKDKSVPPLMGEGIVLRCIKALDNRYHVAFKLTGMTRMAVA